MKNILAKTSKYIKEALLVIVAVPAYGIIALTRGKKNSANDLSNFTVKFINEFKDEIQKDLVISTLPDIFVSREQKMNGYRYFGEFDVKNPNTEKLSILSNNKVISGTDGRDDSVITIYSVNCYKASAKHNILTKLCIAKTVIHELCHYRQLLECRFHQCTSASVYGHYAVNTNEIEARKASKRFCIKNIKKLFMFLIRN